MPYSCKYMHHYLGRLSLDLVIIVGILEVILSKFYPQKILDSLNHSPPI